MATRMQQKRGTAAEWAAANPVLSDGEIGFEKDTGIVKLGNGSSTWNQLQPILTGLFLPVNGKAYDAERLDGLDSTAFWKATDATTERTRVDGLILPTGANRKLVTHFGSGVAYPTTADGVRLGDRYYRTDLLCEMMFAADNTWRQVETPSMTATQRKAINIAAGTVLYKGFTVHENDTQRLWLYDGGGWQYIGGGEQPRVKLIGANVSGLPQTDGPWNSWAAPEYDSDEFWDATNFQLKVPAGLGGTYDVAVYWNLGGTVASTTNFAFRVIKKARTAQTSPPTSSILNGVTPTSAGPLTFSGPVRLAQNEIVSFQYWTNQATLAGGGSQFGTPSFVSLIRTGVY